MLAGPDTCSASESVVNSLRGVGVTVNLVGGATCGKPYGFFPQDNCGTTYFAIQFQGVNQQGFGDYGDGFAPTCAVADDFGHALGDPAEAGSRRRWPCAAAAPARARVASKGEHRAAQVGGGGHAVSGAFADPGEPAGRGAGPDAALARSLRAWPCKRGLRSSPP